VLAFDGTGSLTNRYLHGPLVDQVLADENLLEDDVFWALADHLGTVRRLVDNAGNAIRDRIFSAWGQVVEDTNPTFAYPFAFTGREYDVETGLYYYRARYYDPHTGRFLSEDPSASPRATPTSPATSSTARPITPTRRGSSFSL
jgi:RHS repeat-associated protein